LACFTALIMSLPAFASATTSAPKACAAICEEENSCALSGFFGYLNHMEFELNKASA
jgi:hypothetical protein